MSHSLKIIILFVLIFLSGFSVTIQGIYGQNHSFHDSLKQSLIHLHENTLNEKLKQAIQEAQANYTVNIVTDSLSRKLLNIQSILANDSLHPTEIIAFGKLVTRLLSHLPPAGEHPDYAYSLDYLGGIYHKTRKYDTALLLYQQALDIKRKSLGEEHLNCATSLNNIAQVYEQTHQPQKAAVCYEEILAIRRKAIGEENNEDAIIFISFGRLYTTLGRYEDAISAFRQASVITKKIYGEEHDRYATALSWLGIVYYEMGQYDEALELAQQSLAIARKIFGEEHLDYAIRLSHVAVLFFMTGRYDKALPVYQQVSAILKRTVGVEHPSYAQSLNNIAALYNSIGENDKAVPLLSEALAIRKKIWGEEHSEYPQNMNNLALAYQAMQQYDKAFPLYEKALAIRKKIFGEEHPEYAHSLNILGALYSYTGEYQKALPLLEQALNIRKKKFGEESVDYAVSLNDMAAMFRDMGEWNKALSHFEQALLLRTKIFIPEHPDYTKNLNELGSLYMILGQYEKAEALLSRASALKLNHLLLTYTSLSEQAKIAYINKEALQFSYLPSVLLLQKEKKLSLIEQVFRNELALKGFVLQDQQRVLNSIRKSNDSAALRLYEKWRFNKILLGKQLLLPEKKPGIDSLQNLVLRLEEQLSQYSAAFSGLQTEQHISVKDIAQKLPAGQTTIEFIKFRLYNKKWTDSTIYAALLVLPGDTNAHFIPLCEEKQLLSLLATTAQASQDEIIIENLYGNDRQTGRWSDSLYKLIWAPLEKYLQGIHTIYYAPVGLLHRLAFRAIRNGNANFLADKYNLIQVLSNRSVIVPAQTTTRPVSASIWGNIKYTVSPKTTRPNTAHNKQDVDTSFNFYTADTRNIRGGGWAPLPASRKEMDTIQKLLRQARVKISLFSNTQASEEAFKSLDGKSPQILHLATHGFFLPIAANKSASGEGQAFKIQENPMFRSGLILAGGNHAWKGEHYIPGKEDGILTAYEIAQMDLSNTDLLVLSACETALGDLQGNEGVIGLQRAFKMAGVKQMILSLWSVYDNIARELMILFYKFHLKGQSAREAFRNAQLKIKEKYPDPYDWASFVLIE